MGSCCGSSCCGGAQQAPVGIGGNGLVPVVQPQPVQRQIADFDGSTTYSVGAARSVLPAVNERLIRVATDFVGGDDDWCPIEDRFYFNDYFGATTWIIAEVYKRRDQTGFYLNQAIAKQLQLAQAYDLTLPNRVHPTAHPTLIIIKHVENAASLDWLNTELGGRGQTGVLDTDRFLASPTFGKAITRILADIGGGAHATHVNVLQGPDIHITVA
jgi:hypothetical protein